MNGTQRKLLVCGVRIVVVDKIIEEGSILIDDGRITHIGSGEAEAPFDVETLDLAGLSVFPGFIDVHIHGAMGVDVMDATPADLLEISKYLCSQGVTAWLATFVPAPDENYVIAVEAMSQTNCDGGAEILGVHYEGPFVSSAQCGALHGEYFKTYGGPQDLDCLPVPPNSLHMMTVAPEVQGGLQLVSELKRRGWVISIGHTRAGLEILESALTAGAGHMTHFMNAMIPMHHRMPGPVSWGLSHDDVSCDIIADGIHLDPFILRLLVKIKKPQRLTLISDAIAATGLGDGAYKIWGDTITVTNGRTKNQHGNIAGSVITMLDAVRLMKSLGVSDIDVAQMASTNPAHLLGIDHECGSLEIGKRADLVAIDANCEVKLTIVNGKVAFRA